MTSVLSLLWIGLLIGVSFIATPAKFRAPSLSVPAALDVGRVTFALFGRIEALLAVALVLSTLDFSSGQFRSAAITASAIAALIVGFQTTWLRPILDQRVAQVIDGGDVSKSKVHTLYIGLEVAKLGLLAVVAVSS